MNIHWCWINRQCRAVHAPYRLEITVRGWYILIGTRNGKSQTWNPWAGTTKTWRRISIRPSRSRYCWHALHDKETLQPYVCSRLAGHRGEHRGCFWGRKGQ